MSTELIPVIIREGSSSRTYEELIVQFAVDVRELADLTTDYDVKDTAEQLVQDARHAAGCEECGEDCVLECVVHDAETLLGDIGYYVDWDDGYAIYE